MEKFKLQWVQSTSDFAASQDVLAKLSGGAEQVLQSGLGMSANNIIFDFVENDQVEWWVRTRGDNATQADSVHDTFQAINASVVLPATGLTHTFIQHLP